MINLSLLSRLLTIFSVSLYWMFLLPDLFSLAWIFLLVCLVGGKCGGGCGNVESRCFLWLILVL